MNKPDETRSFEKGKVEVTNLDTVSIGRFTLEPGWSWSTCVKPIAKTSSCQLPHTQYIVSGRLRIKMEDGSEDEFGPGDTLYAPPGHDAWVVGNVPAVGIDFTGFKDYAKSK